MNSTIRLAGLLLGACAAAALPIAEARACGCIAPPNPAEPVVQAGERIIFSVKDSQVTAHIQIQYAGKADEFGWLLPLPSLPTLEVGSDELFSQLGTATRPQYTMETIYPANGCFFNRGGGPFPGAGGSDLGQAAFGDAGANDPQPSPLVVQDSIGPYDYAVLKADDGALMLKWLADNHYFVPAGTMESATPYLHPGAFFLALKLRSGKSAGDIQPVIVKYASDLPMIPIILTSVGAQPDMGIQVWMLGPGRAIPRNYRHTVVNDAAINWWNGGQNYRDVVIRATKEADKRHTFVTEFAGPAKPIGDTILYPGRFGDPAEFLAITGVREYLALLRAKGYSFTAGSLVTVLEKYINVPQKLIDSGISTANFYLNFDFYMDRYIQRFPNLFEGYTPAISDVKALTDEIQMRVVKPLRDGAELFTTFPYLTRLYTTLSASDMTADPVFSYNTSLPAVGNVHKATLVLVCNMMSPTGYDGVLRTEQGFLFNVPGGFNPPTLPDLPASLRIETLRETGTPEVETDNATRIHQLLEPLGDTTLSAAGGCAVEPPRAGRGTLVGAGLALAALAIVMVRRRRRG